MEIGLRFRDITPPTVENEMGKNTETAVIVLIYGFNMLNMLKLDTFSYPLRIFRFLWYYSNADA